MNVDDSSGATPLLKDDIAALVRLSRLLWTGFLDDALASPNLPAGPARSWALNTKTLERLVSGYATGADLARLVQLRTTWDVTEANIWIPESAVRPLALVRANLDRSAPEPLLRYHVMASIREHYKLSLSAETVRVIRRLSDAINALFTHTPEGTDNLLCPSLTPDELFQHLRVAFPQGRDHDIAFFLEALRACDLLHIHGNRGRLVFPDRSLDSDRIVSTLFGLPTGIKGFDDLFGGGMLLADHQRDGPSARIGGRLLLVTGRYGTGKSLLSLQLAMEVATKGGVAWVIRFEQSAEECLYMLAVANALHEDGSMRPATDVQSAVRLLENPTPGVGAFIILNAARDSLEGFQHSLHQLLPMLGAYPCSLIIVDPVTAIARDETSSIPTLRSRMVELLTAATSIGTNVCLVSEETGGDRDAEQYEQNIADTVIRLSVDGQEGAARRLIEVTKSRLQKEASGKHAFAIRSGSGAVIFPSSAAVLDRVRRRVWHEPSHELEFGVVGLDEVLGGSNLREGDIICLRGPRGSLKSALGLHFLQRLSAHHAGAALLPQTPALLLRTRKDAPTRPWSGMGPEELLLQSVVDPTATPGELLQTIEECLRAVTSRSPRRCRVFIDDLADWVSTARLESEEPTFPVALIKLLRAYGVSAVVALTTEKADDPYFRAFERAVIDGVNCALQLERVVFRGRARVELQVLKSPRMSHRRERFELEETPFGCRVRSTGSLLRVGAGGQVEPLSVTMFLHSETDRHVAYNQETVNSLRASLSTSTTLVQSGRPYLGRALGMSPFSAVDELQVMQLDEFQLPDLRGEAPVPLYEFLPSEWEAGSWDECLANLVSRVRRPSGRFVAVPFYENVSLLAFRTGEIPEECTRDWHSLAGACERFEQQQEEVFFDFSDASTGDLNSLFFEILLSLKPKGFDGTGRILPILTTPEAVEACLLLRTLCRRAHRQHQRVGGEAGSRERGLNPAARVWRASHSKIHEAKSSSEFGSQFVVRPLPGGISTAGSTYLAVPAYSAAPGAGLEVIRSLTDHRAEMERLKLGIGLPTRRPYYAREHGSLGISPYAELDGAAFAELVAAAYRWSTFAWDMDAIGVMSQQLRGFIELDDEQATPQQVSEVLDGLFRRISYMESSG